VNVSVPKGPETSKYRNNEEEFKDALLRYSVRRIEDALKDENFLITSANEDQEFNIGAGELLLIKKLMEEKNCGYQIKEEKISSALRYLLTIFTRDTVHHGAWSHPVQFV
jgi:hypothetical protein